MVTNNSNDNNDSNTIGSDRIDVVSDEVRSANDCTQDATILSFGSSNESKRRDRR